MEEKTAFDIFTKQVNETLIESYKSVKGLHLLMKILEARIDKIEEKIEEIIDEIEGKLI